MLQGIEITLGGAVVIAFIGLVIVLLELTLISLFVRLLSTVIGKMEGKAKTVPHQAAPAPVLTAPSQIKLEEAREIAAVMNVTIEEDGGSREEMIFKSITRK